MRLLLVSVGILVGILAIAYFGLSQRDSSDLLSSNKPQQTTSSSKNIDNKDYSQQTVIAEGLDTPWAIAFMPDNSMLVTERKGTVRLVDSNGSLQSNPVSTIDSVREIGEGGLLGIAIDPNFESNNYVYLYYTYSGSGDNTQNRVVRMKYQDNNLIDETILIDAIPGASNHNGGRIAFGPDGYLYVTTGDASQPSLAQDKNSLAGKILRVKPDGSAAEGNPFSNRIYSYGHRNPQGLAWDKDGNLWSTEHGPSGAETGNDEINLIKSGQNYGWPDIVGQETKPGMENPLSESGNSDTWAPAGAIFIGTSLFFGGLRGQALYEANVSGQTLTSLNTHFKNEFGRIREVVKGPDNMLYITTSNKDGRGNPKTGDDKIIRVNPEKI